MNLTRKCHDCGQDFRKEEIIQYSTYSGKTKYNLCRDCYEKRIARENFSNKVCQIFGIKAPGPRIWKERQRLQEKFGFTDGSIVDCLDYIYNVEHETNIKETLYLVTPVTMAKMMQYKRTQAAKAELLGQAAKQETKEYIVPIEEKEERKKQILNPDDFLDD